MVKDTQSVLCQTYSYLFNIFYCLDFVYLQILAPFYCDTSVMVGFHLNYHFPLSFQILY